MKFYKGQKVVCVNDTFNRVYSPKKKKLSTRDGAISPKKGQTLVVDKVILYSGQTWLNFREYDTRTRFEWWVSMQFRPLNDFRITVDGISWDQALSSSD
jgi:hypothetical protein